MESLRYKIRPNIFEEYMPKRDEGHWSAELYCSEKSDFRDDLFVGDQGSSCASSEQSTDETEAHSPKYSPGSHIGNDMASDLKTINENITNTNKVDNGNANKVDKQDRQRKTSVTINGKFVNFAEQNCSKEVLTGSGKTLLKCVDIDIGENKTNVNKDGALTNTTKEQQLNSNENHEGQEDFDKILDQFDIFQTELNELSEEITEPSERRFSKLSEEIASSNHVDKPVVKDYHNNISDKNVKTFVSKKDSTKVHDKIGEIFFQNNFSYISPQFVNVDTVQNQSKKQQQNDVQLLKNKRESFAYQTTRRRSLSTGYLGDSGELLKQNPLSKSVNNLSGKTFYETEICVERSDSDYTTSDDELDEQTPPLTTVFTRQKKKSFIGKSISVDVVTQDNGFTKRKYRRRGVFFDSKSVESNSEEDDFLSDLLAFKKKYKLQKREKSTGLRIARSVENLLKIDKTAFDTTRKRSNTDTKEAKHSTKKKTHFLGKKFRQNKENKMEYIRETSLLDDDDDAFGDIETETGKARPNIALVGNTVQKVAGIIEMYMDKKGDVIRKIEIHKVQGQSLGFFIRFGNGIERENGIFLSRVTLGSFVDVNNLLHAGDEILTINKVDVTNHSLEEVALMMQRSETLIIKTRSALPLPMHACPLLKSYDTRYGKEEIRSTLAEHEKNRESLKHHQRANSDPFLLSESSEEDDIYRGRTRTDTNPHSLDDFPEIRKTKLCEADFSRKLPMLPTESKEESCKSFSRAQRYLSKSPTIDLENTEEETHSKSSKIKIMKSPKLFRKSENKKIQLLNGGSSNLRLPRQESIQSPMSDDDISPLQSERMTVYANDGLIQDHKSMPTFNGRLVVHVKQLHGRLSSLDGDCYCTIEINDEYKATTQAKPTKGVVNFDEYFDIELRNAYALTFYIFFKPHKRQHKLLSQTCIHLGRLLNEKPKCQLLLTTTNNVQVRIGLTFTEAGKYLQRTQSTRSRGVFGFNLSQTLVLEENTIPILVRKCVEEIEKRGLDLVGIYRISGNARKKKLLRMQFDEDSINTDVSDPEIDCHVIAGILKDYLRELPNPLISQETYMNIYNKSQENKGDKTEKLLANLMKKLPYTNRSTLIYIMEHIQRVAERSAENKMDYKNLAVCFGPVMMCPPITKGSSVVDMFDFKKQIQALEFLLTIWPSRGQQNSV